MKTKKNFFSAILFLATFLLGCQKEDILPTYSLVGEYFGSQTSSVLGQIPEQTRPIIKTFYMENDSLCIRVFDSPHVVARTSSVSSKGYICIFNLPSDAYCFLGKDTVFHKKLLLYKGEGIVKDDSIFESGTIIYTDSIKVGSLTQWNFSTSSTGSWSAKLAKK